MIFIVTGGKLKVALQAEEVIIASRNRGVDELVQRSTFVAIPTGEGHPRAIEETRSSTVNGKLKVLRRYFRWSPLAKQYLP